MYIYVINKALHAVDFSHVGHQKSLCLIHNNLHTNFLNL